MLSAEQNDQITRTTPGTAAGALMRRYWQPAALVDELSTNRPVKALRLLGEDLTLYKDLSGTFGLVDRHCPHRRASLFFGRNEECGLRCVYHGWKFDVAGNCVDMPNEPLESRFKDKIHQQSYPTLELGGVVWAYLGPPEKRPEAPGMAKSIVAGESPGPVGWNAAILNIIG